MSTIREIFECPTVRRYNPRGVSKVTSGEIASEELIGIEVEVENARIVGSLSELWVSKGDGSLRNNGVEFVSQPFPASAAPWALENLLKGGINPDASFSMRTSVHVHLNVQEMESEDVKSLLLLYCLFEPLLYQFTGRGRNKNIYCMPIIETQWCKSLVDSKLAKWDKYTGLNIKTLANYGTIEFRHMHGTFDTVKLTRWIDIITSMKRYVLATPQKAVRERIRSIGKGFDFAAYAVEVFGADNAAAMPICRPADLANSALRTKYAFCTANNARRVSELATSSSPFLSDVNKKG